MNSGIVQSYGTRVSSRTDEDVGVTIAKADLRRWNAFSCSFIGTNSRAPGREDVVLFFGISGEPGVTGAASELKMSSGCGTSFRDFRRREEIIAPPDAEGDRGSLRVLEAGGGRRRPRI